MGNILHFAVLAILIWILISKTLVLNASLTLGEPHKPKHTFFALSFKHDSMEKYVQGKEP